MSVRSPRCGKGGFCMPTESSGEERLALPAEFARGRIGVVTVLYNSAPVLEDFFASIETQSYGNFVVYCVDNASTDASVERCRDRGDRYVVIESGKNAGVAAGNNTGTRAAVADGCEYVLYLNNDVVFGPELFGQLVDGLWAYRCAMTTPMMCYHDRPEVVWAAGGYFQPWLGYRCLHRGQGELVAAQSSLAAEVSYTPTCCVLVRREVFAEIGIMDERYFVYYDDTDFMLRAWRAGKKLYLLPHARLRHKVSSLAGPDSAFTRRYLTRNHAFFNHKHVSGLGAWLVSALYCAYYPAMWLRGRMARAEAFARVGDWKDGIRLAGGGSR
jgi:GT2 family glycosyltransferase